ncbi:MAG: PAS domain S-box protein [Pseudomonadota bacterium]
MSSDPVKIRLKDFIKVRLRLFEFAASHSLEELLQKTLDEICALTESPIGFFHFMKSDQKTLVLQAWSTRTKVEFCRAEGNGIHYNIDQAGVWVDCVRQRQPVIHNDYKTLGHRKGMPEGHAEVVRELVVPIMRTERIVAILGIGNKPFDYTNEDLELVSFIADVSWVIIEQKRMEETLRKEKKFLQNIIETAQAIILVLDPDGNIISINPFMEKLSGYRLDEVKDKEWFSTFLPERDQDNVRTLFLRAIDNIRTKGNINTIVLKDGSEREIEWYDRTLKDDKGEVVGLLAIGQDVTDRTRAEKSLLEREVFLNELINSIPIPVFYKDRAGRYLGFNKAFETFFGETKERLIGKSVFEINPSKLAEIYLAKDNELFEAKGIQQYEAQVKSMHGELRDVIFNKSVFTDINGAVIGLIGAVVDITETKRAEQERERLISDLQNALHKVKQLRGLLPICSHCKKIRDDKGYWNQIEAYIAEHSDAEFSHSICQECAEKYYPGIGLYDDKTQR